VLLTDRNKWLSKETNMTGTQLKIRFSKKMEILLWLAGLGVLTKNIVLLQQNRHQTLS